MTSLLGVIMGQSASDYDAASLIARSATAVPDAQKTRVSTAIVSLKSAGIWAKLDTFIISPRWQDEQAGLLDWKRSVSFVKRGSASWSSTLGFVGNNSAGSCFDSMFVPSTDSLAASLNSFSTFAYVSAVGSTAFDYLVGSRNSGGTSRLSIFESTSDAMEGYAFSTSNTFTAASKASTGLMAIVRTGASAVDIYFDGTAIGTGGKTAASASLIGNSIAVVGENFNGNYAGSTAKVSAFGYGAELSTGEQSTLKSIIDAYMA